MGTEFTPIFLFIVVAVFTAISMIVLSAILGPRKTTAVKQMPYESGMDPIGDARQRFDVRYYLVAIVFLLFDVELLFLYPWAVAQYSADIPVIAAVAGLLALPRALRVRHPRRVPRAGVRRDPGLHHRPGGGLRLRLAKRGLRMALGIPTTGGPGTPPSNSTGLDRRTAARRRRRGSRRGDPYQAQRCRELGRQLRPQE